MRLRTFIVTAFGVLFVSGQSVPAFGQTAQVGQVVGDVTDPTGGKVPGALVVLTSVERGTSRETRTDPEGTYLFAQVSPGRYDVAVTLSGFATRKMTGNVVEAEKTTRIPIVLSVAAIEVSATVTGEVPIVDARNQTDQTRLRVEEFERMPLGRSYQSLIASAPGVVGTGNVNSHGAVTNSNQFLFDGVNTTDPTTGTFGANLNYEAIQEVLIRTSGLSAEFGRSTGAFVDVITKSGTNRLGGSFKYLVSNDNWNVQNSTKSEVDNSELKRTKFDHVNPIYSTTIGGPILKNRAWFFLAHEQRKATSAQTQLNARPGITPENYQQTTTEPFFNLRITDQLATNQNVWLKVVRSPTTGFVRNDYWPGFGGITAERFATTGQDQGGTAVSAQYTGAFGASWTTELMVGRVGNFINVFPFIKSPLNNGAPYWDLVDNRVYNGASFDGFVNRPRNQATAAASYFAKLGGNSHSFKVGIDWQGIDSKSQFAFPNNQIYYGQTFDPVSRTFAINDSREDYDPPALSKSHGTQTGLYGLDRFQMGTRVSVEAGLRLELGKGHSDVGALTVDTTSIEPRLSGSYSLTPDGKTLLEGTYGRFHDAVLLTFSDAFAGVPQQGNYNTSVWNGTTYVFASRSTSDANTFTPNTDISPRQMDEYTVAFERQLGKVVGTSARYISRDWSNFVDDVRSFNTDGTLHRVVQNITDGKRTYRALELTLEKRLSNSWSSAGSYTYSRSRGNHFDTGDGFTTLDDYLDATCRQTVDVGLFNGGTFPCRELQANYFGKASYDRPHLIKFNGTYFRSLGPINLTAGMVGSAASKIAFQKQRTVNVLSPSGNQFAMMTYFYEPRGSQRVPGMLVTADLALEAGYKLGIRQGSNVGVKFDIFNLFNNEEKINVSNTAWCNATTSAACQTTVNNFGKASTRAAFQAPRTYRVTMIFRY